LAWQLKEKKILTSLNPWKNLKSLQTPGWLGLAWQLKEKKIPKFSLSNV